MAKRGRLVVLFSGGLDSTLLAKLAYDVLGKDAAALTIDSAVVPRSEIAAGRALAAEIGIRQHVLLLNELEQEHFKTNPPDRCYHCRKTRDAAAWRWAGENGYPTIADGLSYSDLDDYRPGLKAATEDLIWHPFIEFRVGKKDIREFSRERGLPGLALPPRVSGHTDTGGPRGQGRGVSPRAWLPEGAGAALPAQSCRGGGG